MMRFNFLIPFPILATLALLFIVWLVLGIPGVVCFALAMMLINL